MKRRIIILTIMSLTLLGAACGRMAATTNTSTVTNTANTASTINFDTNDNLDQALQDLNQAY